MTTDFLAFITPNAEGAPDVVIEAARACIERFSAAFNRCDIAGMDAELSFPHTMLSGASRLVWSATGQHPADLFADLQASGWQRSRYVEIDPVVAGDEKVHFRVVYERLAAGGRVLSRHVNVWIVVRKDGLWRIALRSY